MAGPLIPLVYGVGKAALATAAGKAARYGAKKLAKKLVKRGSKKLNVKAKRLEEKNFRKDSADNPFGLLKPEKGMHPPYPKVKTLRGKKRTGSYRDPELNSKGNKVMQKAYKDYQKSGNPEKYDFQSGMIKESFPKKFFKKKFK